MSERSLVAAVLKSAVIDLRHGPGCNPHSERGREYLSARRFVRSGDRSGWMIDALDIDREAFSERVESIIARHERAVEVVEV